jgi:ABC-type polar amino acid transport system ATPase subunit
MLRGTAITKTFGSLTALAGIDIDVQPGRVSILIGPSGAGKTTLIRALSLLDVPTTGSIHVDDIRYEFPLGRGRRIKEPWPYLTVVFQQQFLWPHLTLRENIALPLSKRRTADSAAVIAELVDLFGMASFVDRYPNQVSLGERQRAALARALALNPRYILLDEITSALDVEQTANLTRYLINLRDRGIGILVVTHFLAFARRLVERGEGDTVYFMEAGRVVEKGGADFFTGTRNVRVQSFLSALEFQGELGVRQ